MGRRDGRGRGSYPGLLHLSLLLVAIAFAAAPRQVVAAAVGGACKTPAYAQPPRGRPADALVLRDDRFERLRDGATVHIKAVNWFGFNNRGTMLDGLWSGGSAAASDFAAITWQLRLLGFNGVRLPFLFDDVLRRPPTNATLLSWCSPTTPEVLARRAVDPGSPSDIKSAAGQPVPKPAVPLPPAGGDNTRCNSYLPWTSTLDRFLFVVQWFAANGFYVLLDYHPMGNEYTSYDARAFVGNWTTVWRSVTCLPNFQADLKGRVFLDLLNEPDSIGQRWERSTPQGGRGEAAGLTELYLSAMDAIWQMTPGAPIFFVEGGGQTGLRGVNWGNGFATDRALIAERALSDPNPFFEGLLKRPYRASVVVSPHVYGPSVSTATDTYSGPSLVKMLDTSFGYLSKQGYCTAAVSRRTGRALLDAEDEAAFAAATAAAGASAATLAAAEAEEEDAADFAVAAAAPPPSSDGSNSTSASTNTSTSASTNNNSTEQVEQRQQQQPPTPVAAPPPAAVVRDCQRFPVSIGEFGSRFESPEDLAHLNDFAAYLNNEGVGRTDGHNAIGSWNYWAYNDNSWDTGGLVDSTWQNLLWTKLRFLRGRLGMKGWYQGSAAAAGEGADDGRAPGEEGQNAMDLARRLEAEAADRDWWEAGGAAQEAAAAPSSSSEEEAAGRRPRGDETTVVKK